MADVSAHVLHVRADSVVVVLQARVQVVFLVVVQDHRVSPPEPFDFISVFISVGELGYTCPFSSFILLLVISYWIMVCGGPCSFGRCSAPGR